MTSDSYAEYNEDSNKKDPKLKVGDHVRIWKYKNIFVKTGQKKFLLLVKLLVNFIKMLLVI